MFLYSGYLKLAVLLADLTKMGMIWPSQVSPGFLLFIGIVDTVGGLGLLLPALTRIMPHLNVLAALGCSVLRCLRSRPLSAGRVRSAPAERHLAYRLAVHPLGTQQARANFASRTPSEEVDKLMQELRLQILRKQHTPMGYLRASQAVRGDYRCKAK